MTVDWQERAGLSGLKQRLLAKIAGRSEFQISQQMTGKVLGGVPRYIQSIILAWEMLTPDQRKAWLQSIESLPEIPKSKRPQNLPEDEKPKGRPAKNRG